MERKTTRISKEPEACQREMLDTAMSVFIEEGYKAATMRDIAAAMHVVPGLCCRYYRSRQVLYNTVIKQCMKDITYPMIELLKEAKRLLDGFLDKTEQLLMQTDEREKYHHSFHKKENYDLRMLISVKLCETIKPYMREKLRMMNEKGIIRVRNIPTTTSYMLFGVIPVLENNELSIAEKASSTRMVVKCTLGP